MKHDIMLLDIELQRDFFDPGGSCFGPESARALNKLHKLFEWAREESIPVLSTVLRVRPGEHGPLSQKPHCIEGTEGEQKMAFSALPGRINLGLRNTTDLPADIFDRHQQIIFEKRDTDIFAHARAERLITELEGGAVVVCGAGIARGIVQAAVGLRTRGFGVIFARDAAIALDDPLTEMALLRMEAKGVVFTDTEEIVAPRRMPRTPFRRGVTVPEGIPGEGDW